MNNFVLEVDIDGQLIRVNINPGSMEYSFGSTPPLTLEQKRRLHRVAHDCMTGERSRYRNELELLSPKTYDAPASEITKEPPLMAQTVMAFFSDRKTVDAMLGDMQERFNANAKKHGDTYARRRYWQEVLRSITPSIWRRIQQAGLLGMFVGYVRSKLGW